MIYYKNKVNGEIYEVNDIHRKDDAFYYVFGNEFKKERIGLYESVGKKIDLFDKDKGHKELNFQLNYDSSRLFLVTHMKYDNNNPFAPKAVDLKNQNFVASDSSEDLYYILYKRMCNAIDIPLLNYNVLLKEFNFDNEDIFKIISEDCKEVKDFKIRNLFK
ncbi:hypothetical protein UFVDC4_00025 [Staphylococcus phage vB_SauM-UFV_DC4]|nr:hypothetical protein UFVDC4_00025 [Staphylococcus phage vB_SauM-UFV_DC4]